MRNYYLVVIGITTGLSLFCVSPRSSASPDLDTENRVDQKFPENFVSFVPNLYSGGEPSEEHLKLLHSLGVTTIVSVDGAEPNVEAVEELGIKYIHLPIGYDFVPNQVVATLMQLDPQLKTKIYLHCHHGKHRGPAVAAIYSVLTGSISKEEAIDKMQSIGTGREYKGLWHSVSNIDKEKISNTKQLPIVSSQKVDDLTASMATIDRLYDNVKHHLNTADPKLNKHEELLHQTVLLQESLKESYRLDTHEWINESEYDMLFKRTNTLADQLVSRVKSNKIALSQSTLKTLKQSCKACHTDYRN